jgi:hypothetical protein
MAQADNVQIPITPPPILPNPGSIPTWLTGGQQPAPEYYTTPISSLNPLQVLQQPAYYYYAAADCTLERKKRFEVARAVQEDAQESDAGGHIALAPGYANETKVDHAGLAIEVSRSHRRHATILTIAAVHQGVFTVEGPAER